MKSAKLAAVETDVETGYAMPASQPGSGLFCSRFMCLETITMFDDVMVDVCNTTGVQNAKFDPNQWFLVKMSKSVNCMECTPSRCWSYIVVIALVNVVLKF